jgi:hypothetical protein
MDMRRTALVSYQSNNCSLTNEMQRYSYSFNASPVNLPATQQQNQHTKSNHTNPKINLNPGSQMSLFFMLLLRGALRLLMARRETESTFVDPLHRAQTFRSWAKVPARAVARTP